MHLERSLDVGFGVLCLLCVQAYPRRPKKKKKGKGYLPTKFKAKKQLPKLKERYAANAKFDRARGVCPWFFLHEKCGKVLQSDGKWCKSAKGQENLMCVCAAKCMTRKTVIRFGSSVEHGRLQISAVKLLFFFCCFFREM